MKYVDILSVKNKTINSIGLVSPLIASRDIFLDTGVTIRNIYTLASDIIESDVLIIDSKYYKNRWAKKDEVLRELDSLRAKVNLLFWFDTGDSTGLLTESVFSCVDYYLKSQVLKNRSLYESEFYGGRLHTDYYYKSNNVVDDQPIYSSKVSPKHLLSKLRNGWNYGLATGYCQKPSFLQHSLLKRLKTQMEKRSNNYQDPRVKRSVDVFLRMNTIYQRETIAYQRKLTINLLGKFGSTHSKVSKRKYIQEMRSSKLVVSPFGWGEINIRDFECFVSGATLVKPDMSHLDTFPQYYIDGETYISIDWSLNNLADTLDELLENYSRYAHIAECGQNKIQYYAENQGGREEFVDHVSELLLQ